MAFGKDNDALREAANKALAEIKKDGTFARSYRKWFRKDPPEADPEGHALSLLGRAAP